MSDNKTVLDFKDYPDIDIFEFSDWFEEKFLKIVIGNNDINWYNGKYDVDVIVHRDWENRKFSLELQLVDVTDYTPDPHLEEIIKQLKHDKPDGNGLKEIDGIIDEVNDALSNRKHIDIDKLREDLGVEPIPEKNRLDQVKFHKTYY